jgi:hypothetical protein
MLCVVILYVIMLCVVTIIALMMSHYVILGNAVCHFAKCFLLIIIVLSNIRLSVLMLNVLVPFLCLVSKT